MVAQIFLLWWSRVKWVSPQTFWCWRRNVASNSRLIISALIEISAGMIYRNLSESAGSPQEVPDSSWWGSWPRPHLPPDLDGLIVPWKKPQQIRTSRVEWFERSDISKNKQMKAAVSGSCTQLPHAGAQRSKRNTTVVVSRGVDPSVLISH